MILKLHNLDDALKKSKNNPVLIYIHSISCGISSMALTHINKFNLKNQKTIIYQVIVQEDKPMSDTIEKRLQVKHESPQLILINKGKLISVLNHFDITYNNIKKILSQ